jgi:hypothetical protein
VCYDCDYVRSAPHLYAARVLKEPTGVCPETEGSIIRWLVDADLFYSLLEPIQQCNHPALSAYLSHTLPDVLFLTTEARLGLYDPLTLKSHRDNRVTPGFPLEWYADSVAVPVPSGVVSTMRAPARTSEILSTDWTEVPQSPAWSFRRSASGAAPSANHCP